MLLMSCDRRANEGTELEGSRMPMWPAPIFCAAWTTAWMRWSMLLLMRRAMIQPLNRTPASSAMTLSPNSRSWVWMLRVLTCTMA